MSKRANNEGSIVKLKSGNWRCQFMDGYKDDGRRNVLSFSAPTKSEVQQMLRDYWERKQKPEAAQIGEDMDFSAWAELWYKDYEDQVQASTYANYRFTLDHLIRQFRQRPLGSIRQIEINQFLNGLYRQGLSQSSVSKCKAMLIQIFDAAEENELILRNPARHAKASRRREDEEESAKDAFTEEELQRLMCELPDTLLGNSIRVLLVSGMRVQELLALRPEDIEPDGSAIHICHAVKMVKGCPSLGTPKSKRSRRTVPIAEDYRCYVLRLLEQGGKAFLWTSVKSESLLVGVGVFRRQYYKALREIGGVRLLTPHCTRHTYITRLQAKGVPMEIVARLVGHSEIRTTDGYTHTSLETLSQAVSTMNAN